MRTTLVLNAKGGSGKTTISTNLSGYLAAIGRSVVLQDYDPQGSSTEWLKNRSFQLNQIHGQELYKTGSQYMTRAFQFRLPSHTEHVIVDTAAAIDLQKNVSTIRKADKIVIPVSPSAIEVRATLNFIEELQKFIKLYSCPAEVAVVANKVDTASTAYKIMQQKFEAAGISFIAQLSQHDQYYVAAETGASIFELENPLVAKDKFEWAPLINWIEGQVVEKTSPEKSALFAVVE
jgi:chromosome partitioning protein